MQYPLIGKKMNTPAHPDNGTRAHPAVDDCSGVFVQ